MGDRGGRAVRSNESWSSVVTLSLRHHPNWSFAESLLVNGWTFYRSQTVVPSPRPPTAETSKVLETSDKYFHHDLQTLEIELE